MIIAEAKYVKELITGDPKEAGKTTLALRLTPKGKNLILQYDGGDTFPPPEVDVSKLRVQHYPPAKIDFNNSLLNMIPPTNVAHAIMGDIVEVKNAFYQKRDISLANHFDPSLPPLTSELPDTIILDGIPTMDHHLREGMLGEKRVARVAEWPDPVKPDKKNPQNFWDVRQLLMARILDMIIPLPANVILITWSKEEMTYNPKTGLMEKSGKIQPDAGGKMDIRIPGNVDASIYCYSEHPKYYAKLASTGAITKTAVRGRYGAKLLDKIDVTIGNGTVNPWDEILGRRLS